MDLEEREDGEAVRYLGDRALQKGSGQCVEGKETCLDLPIVEHDVARFTFAANVCLGLASAWKGAISTVQDPELVFPQRGSPNIWTPSPRPDASA